MFIYTPSRINKGNDREGWRLLAGFLGWCQCCAQGMSHPSLEEGGTFALISPLIVPLPHISFSLSLLMINQFHRPLWSVVSCYLDTSCHILPGPLVFPWWQCAHPVISLAAPSWWPVATPGPDPQLPSSLPHGPIRLSVCVHVALQPFQTKMQLLADRHCLIDWARTYSAALNTQKSVREGDHKSVKKKKIHIKKALWMFPPLRWNL